MLRPHRPTWPSAPAAAALLLAASACGDEHAFTDAAPAIDAPASDGASMIDAPPAIDAPAAIDAGPIAPDGIPGLLLWLDGASGVGGTSWADRSGAGRNVTCVGPAITTGTINGLPSAHFGGSTYCQLMTDVPRFTAEEDVVFAVAFSLTQGGSMISIQDASANNVVRMGVGNNAFGTIGSVTVQATGIFDDGVPHVFLLVRRANQVSMRVDGVPGMPITVAIPSITGGSIMYVAGAHPIGDLGAELVYHGTISVAQVEGLEAYLLDKFRP